MINKALLKISIFRFVLIIINFYLIVINFISNSMLTLSDIINLYILMLAIIYTIISYYNKSIIMNYISSTLDIILVSLAIFFIQFSKDSSLASIYVSCSFSIYFPLIAITIFRHDPKNSLYTGIISVVCYSILVFIMYNKNILNIVYTSSSGFTIKTHIVNELTKILIMLIFSFITYNISIMYTNLVNIFLKNNQDIQSIRNDVESLHKF
jgi:hypothetical protein